MSPCFRHDENNNNNRGPGYANAQTNKTTGAHATTCDDTKTQNARTHKKIHTVESSVESTTRLIISYH